jgi:iron(III) transport system substrate-binding protein
MPGMMRARSTAFGQQQETPMDHFRGIRRSIAGKSAHLCLAALLMYGAGAPIVAQGQGVSSDAWQKIVESAKKEGTVTLYTSHNLEQSNDLAARFKKEYGIAVQVVRAGGPELQTRVDAEQTTGRGVGDVFVATDIPTITDRNAKKWIVAPVGPAFDSPAYNRKLRVPEGTYFEVSAAVLTFSWNKDLYPKGIKDYPDLLDPALKGKIGVAMVSAMAQVDLHLYLEEKYGADFTKKLADMNPRLYPGALPMAQAVMSGEIAAAVATRPLIEEAKKGVPVGWGLAPGGAWASHFYGQILSGAPHPNAAQLLANFMITQQGQEAVAHVAASALPNVAGAITSTDNTRRTDWKKLNPEFFNAYVAKWKSMYVKQ